MFVLSLALKYSKKRHEIRGGSQIDCKQSLFCSKIGRETQKEELETTSACQRNMRSHEPYVAWALEDERKETALVSCNDLDATLKGRIIHTLTPTPSFEYDTPVSNYIARETEFSFVRCNEWFYAKEACFKQGYKKK